MEEPDGGGGILQRIIDATYGETVDFLDIDGFMLANASPKDYESAIDYGYHEGYSDGKVDRDRGISLSGRQLFFILIAVGVIGLIGIFVFILWKNGMFATLLG